jgi:hypothetical protein
MSLNNSSSVVVYQSDECDIIILTTDASPITNLHHLIQLLIYLHLLMSLQRNELLVY